MNSLFDPRLSPEARKQWLSVASEIGLHSIHVEYNTDADCAMITYTKQKVGGQYIFAMSREVYETMTEDEIRAYFK